MKIKSRKIVKTALLIEIIILILFLLSNLLGFTTYGHGLGDIYYIISYILIILLIGCIYIFTKKLKLTLLLYLILIIAILLKATIYRGSEYIWNGNLFLNIETAKSPSTQKT